MNAGAVKTSFDEHGRFVVENYNWAKPFSSFLPGIAGKWGIPLWCYTVNRAQVVSSLGTKDKDGAILEFLSFNRACQLIASQGFRTFLRVDGGEVYEPFRKLAHEGVTQRLLVSSHACEIHEFNHALGLNFDVLYYTLVDQPVAGLVRQVTLTNAGSAPHALQLIDGAPRVLPYGVTFEHVKVIARHIEAMMGAEQWEGIPLFRLKQSAEDVARVGMIEGANFYFTCTAQGYLRDAYILDPALLFGGMGDFAAPWAFHDREIDELLNTRQLHDNRTPCAFTALETRLEPGESMRFWSLLGHAPSESRLERFVRNVRKKDFFEAAHKDQMDEIQRIENMAFTLSAEPLFDRYCQQTFLDNVMRGGLPLFIEGESDKHLHYTYIRQGGDLERDYHWFVLEPTYLSQGNGHYRNVLQNRRMDPWFFPDVEEHNIRLFMNLIQTDGYNPLVINGQTYIAEDEQRVRAYLENSLADAAWVEDLVNLALASFTPGEWMMKLEDLSGLEPAAHEGLLAGLLQICRKREVGGLHAGFWIDHWLYNLDAIEAYLAIYPDRLGAFLLEDEAYTFFDDPDVVTPRSLKYVLVGDQVRQYGAVVRDDEKEEMIHGRARERYKVRTREGKVYRTSLLVKLLCLIATRLAAMDPAGLGVEMEAGKPGWCDSLNGLPGMLGSSLCQTLELIRALRLLRAALDELALPDSHPISVYVELADLIAGLHYTMQERSTAGRREEALMYWEATHALLESYRERTRLGLEGRHRDFTIGELQGFIAAGLNLLEPLFGQGSRERTFHPSGVPFTYFINEVVDTQALEEDERQASGLKRVKALAFKQKPAALFLEGPVHFLRVFPEVAAQVYEGVRGCGLYDAALGMFKSSESLADQPLELGRIKAYPAGWIEHEAVYTHMTFKWLLEVLRSGQVDEFMRDLRTTLPPFLEPERYGRSTLENCSFIASTAYADQDSHGRAFQPRLSGVTAEWLHIWTIMAAGERPFVLGEQGDLILRLNPVLPDWLFTREEQMQRFWDGAQGWIQIDVPANSFAFRFLGRILVIYHNPARKPTYGPGGVRVVHCRLHYRAGREIEKEGGTYQGQVAHDVRDGLVWRMEVDLA